MARNETISMTGVIEAVARNGKAFKIGEEWFSVYKAPQMNGAQKGDEVEFEFVEANKGGATFLNVEGNVNVVGAEPEARPARPTRASAARPAARAAAPTRASRSESTAPSGDPRQRSIVRQNSLTQANALLATAARLGILGEQEPEELAELALTLARTFEAYSMVEDD